MGSRGGQKERRPAYWEEEVRTSFLAMVVVGLSLERCRILIEIEIGKGTSGQREQAWSSESP